MKLLLPKTVQVAIFVCAEYLVAVYDGKCALRLFARLKKLSLISCLCFEHDPLDIMFGEHGMVYASDCNCNEVAVLFYNRNMLLGSAVRGISFQKLHCLTATLKHLTCAALYFGNDLSAFFTTIKFHFVLLSI